MNLEGVFTVAMAIVSLATVAVLVSRQAATASIIREAGNANLRRAGRSLRRGDPPPHDRHFRALHPDGMDVLGQRLEPGNLEDMNTELKKHYKRALTIAGSDPSGLPDRQRRVDRSRRSLAHRCTDAVCARASRNGARALPDARGCD